MALLGEVQLLGEDFRAQLLEKSVLIGSQQETACAVLTRAAGLMKECARVRGATMPTAKHLED